MKEPVDFLKAVFGALFLLIGLILSFGLAPLEYEKSWVSDTIFFLGLVVAVTGAVPLVREAWPFLGNFGRIAAFFFAYLVFLLYISEIGTAIEVGFNTYRYLTVPSGSDIPVTSVVVVVLALAGIYFLSIGQRHITRLNL